jgi:hypothetical protein
VGEIVIKTLAAGSDNALTNSVDTVTLHLIKDFSTCLCVFVILPVVIIFRNDNMAKFVRQGSI